MTLLNCFRLLSFEVPTPSKLAFLGLSRTVSLLNLQLNVAYSCLQVSGPAEIRTFKDLVSATSWPSSSRSRGARSTTHQQQALIRDTSLCT